MPKPITKDELDILFPNSNVKYSFSIHKIKRFFRLKFQRLTRGWDDSETWNLDYHLAKLISPRLKRFKELTICHPHEITSEQWDEILDKMIFAFDQIIEDDYSKMSDPDCFEKIKEGLSLFHKYYFDLWW
jgi:hypothetical protein